MVTYPARLVSKTKLSPDISDFCFEIETGSFSGLEPGAHIDVHLGEGLVRQYSIWDWSADKTRLNVAVKQERQGRGGSVAMHQLAIGDRLEIGGARNHFRLKGHRQHITLIAGGIGATPLLAMARQLVAEGADFRIYYLVRSQDHAAFHDQFCQLGLSGQYHLHCDDVDGVFDFQTLVQSMPLNGDIYTCGPEPMLNAVLEAGKHMRGGTIHFERFAAATDVVTSPNSTFEVEINSSGAIFEVPEDQSLLQVLQDKGLSVDVGCTEGLCGSCMVDVLSGEVDHRDGILTPEEQATNDYMCVCVSRAKSKRLVLAL